MNKYLLGIDIGGTKCAVILGNVNHDLNLSDLIIDRVAFETQFKAGAEHTIHKMFEIIDELLQKHSIRRQHLHGIGISCGGPLDSEKGIIMNPPNLYGWDNIPIVDLFEKRYGIKTKIQNDANACAVAEWKFGAAKGCKNAVFLTFGTGMGAGLIIDGKLYTGTNNMAGEVGHIRLREEGPVGFGKIGSFEGFCSGGGIAQIARTKVLEKLQVGIKPKLCDNINKLDTLNAKMVAQAAENGDELAKEIYAISGYYLGKGISILIDILNPEVIVIGSVFQRSKELLYPFVKKAIDEECLSLSKEVCKIKPAVLGHQIGDYAALSLALIIE